jgi:hypothetical protein
VSRAHDEVLYPVIRSLESEKTFQGVFASINFWGPTDTVTRLSRVVPLPRFGDTDRLASSTLLLGTFKISDRLTHSPLSQWNLASALLFLLKYNVKTCCGPAPNFEDSGGKLSPNGNQ